MAVWGAMLSCRPNSFLLTVLLLYSVGVFLPVAMVVAGAAALLELVVLMAVASPYHPGAERFAPSRLEHRVGSGFEASWVVGVAVVALAMGQYGAAALALCCPRLVHTASGFLVVPLLLAATMLELPAGLWIPLAIAPSAYGYLVRWTPVPGGEKTRVRRRRERIDRLVDEMYDHRRREPRPALVAGSDTSATLQWGADYVTVCSVVSKLRDPALRAIVAHELRHTKQGWLEPAWLLHGGGLGLLLMSMAQAGEVPRAVLLATAGLVLVAAEWGVSRYAEIDADRYACETVGGPALAEGLARLAKVDRHDGGDAFFGDHPPLRDRIERARAHVSGAP
jgi:Zn-dependent protease with chaperone function